MRKNNILNLMKLSTFIFALSTLFVSCSNELDEALQPAGNGNLQFVVGDFPTFGEGGQTRAIGLQDAGKTAWAENDAIFVSLYSEEYGLQTVQIKYQSDVWTPDSEVKLSYLKDEMPTITALYAPSYSLDGTVKLKNNMKPGMDEYIETTDCTIEDGKIKINFKDTERSYSRLRIASMPGATLTVTTGDFTPAGPNGTTAPESYTLTADANGNAYLYGTFAANGTVKVVGDVTVEHTFTEATAAENSYALFARRGANLAKLTSTYVINDSEIYYFYGSGNYGIKVENGSPTIILSDANISLNAGDQFDRAVNAIDIVATNSTTTIRVEGTENNITAKYGAGIFVVQGSTVEISSTDKTNKLRVTGNGMSAAIGGYADINSFTDGISCGNIKVNNITLHAVSVHDAGLAVVAPAIGGCSAASCGEISITNAVVYAFGGVNQIHPAPAIGLGISNAGQVNKTQPTVTISDSQLYAYRGGTYADYIGKPQSEVSISLNLGSDGSAKNSTIYCYTGTAATSVDKTVFYDANGTATEQATE